MEEVMIIHVKLSKKSYYLKSKELDVCMLPFTGTAEGPYFRGEILGEGIDTQMIYHDGRFALSARYMLEGTDYKGNPCRVFIENNGEAMDQCIPSIVTDSSELQFLSEQKLFSKVVAAEDSITVKIYKE